MKKKRRKQKVLKSKNFGNDWYDLIDDWALVEASFASQYHIRLRSENDMTWGEFCTLLSGIMSETPLGQIVAIRSEDDGQIREFF